MFQSGMQESKDEKVTIQIEGYLPSFIASILRIHLDDPELFQKLIHYIYTSTTDVGCMDLSKSWSMVWSGCNSYHLLISYRLNLLTNIWLITFCNFVTCTSPTWYQLQMKSPLHLYCRVSLIPYNSMHKILENGIRTLGDFLPSLLCFIGALLTFWEICR